MGNDKKYLYYNLTGVFETDFDISNYISNCMYEVYLYSIYTKGDWNGRW